MTKYFDTRDALYELQLALGREAYVDWIYRERGQAGERQYSVGKWPIQRLEKKVVPIRKDAGK